MRYSKQTVFGFVMCVLAAAYLAMIPFQVSMEPILGAAGRDKINGGFFPIIAGSFLLITSIIFTYGTIRSKVDKGTLTTPEFLWTLLLVLCGLIYAFLVPRIRYLVPTIGILMLLCHLLRPEGMKKYMYLAFPIPVTLIVYYVFSKLFYVALP